MTVKKKALDPERTAGPAADDEDTEGHSMVELFAGRDLARLREQDVQRSLRSREHEVQAHAAQTEAKRPHKK